MPFCAYIDETESSTFETTDVILCEGYVVFLYCFLFNFMLAFVVSVIYFYCVCQL